MVTQVDASAPAADADPHELARKHGLEHYAAAQTGPRHPREAFKRTRLLDAWNSASAAPSRSPFERTATPASPWDEDPQVQRANAEQAALERHFADEWTKSPRRDVVSADICETWFKLYRAGINCPSATIWLKCTGPESVAGYTLKIDGHECMGEKPDAMLHAVISRKRKARAQLESFTGRVVGINPKTHQYGDLGYGDLALPPEQTAAEEPPRHPYGQQPAYGMPYGAPSPYGYGAPYGAPPGAWGGGPWNSPWAPIYGQPPTLGQAPPEVRDNPATARMWDVFDKALAGMNNRNDGTAQMLMTHFLEMMKTQMQQQHQQPKAPDLDEAIERRMSSMFKWAEMMGLGKKEETTSGAITIQDHKGMTLVTQGGKFDRDLSLGMTFAPEIKTTLRGIGMKLASVARVPSNGANGAAAPNGAAGAASALGPASEGKSPFEK